MGLFCNALMNGAHFIHTDNTSPDKHRYLQTTSLSIDYLPTSLSPSHKAAVWRICLTAARQGNCLVVAVRVPQFSHDTVMNSQYSLHFGRTVVLLLTFFLKISNQHLACIL